MNKIYGLNIDALRLCYEVTEPNNINIIKDKEIGEEIDFLYFYLRRIEGKHFKFVYEIRYNDMGKDKLFGELRLGINDNQLFLYKKILLNTTIFATIAES